MVIIGDENIPRYRPYVTWGLIGINFLCWIFVQGMGQDGVYEYATCRFGLTSADLLQTTLPIEIRLGDYLCLVDGVMNPTTLVTYMFMHGSWTHILLNMLVLWVLGDNIEATFGRIRYIIFYIVCGLVAAAFQIASDPDALSPMIGASGAIGGIIGAYLLLYPRNKLTFLLIIIPISAPAWVILGGWFLLQIVLIYLDTNPKIAFWAHVGGFVCGLVLVTLLKKQIRTRLDFPPDVQDS